METLAARALGNLGKVLLKWRVRRFKLAASILMLIL